MNRIKIDETFDAVVVGERNFSNDVFQSVINERVVIIKRGGVVLEFGKYRFVVDEFILNIPNVQHGIHFSDFIFGENLQIGISRNLDQAVCD